MTSPTQNSMAQKLKEILRGLYAGFHPGFFNWGVQHQCHCMCSHPCYTRWGGENYASTDLIGPVGSGGLPIMHCAPNILSKIGIDVRNSRLCDLLQGQIQDFATGGGCVCVCVWLERCMLDHLTKVCSRHTALSENLEF